MAWTRVGWVWLWWDITDSITQAVAKLWAMRVMLQLQCSRWSEHRSATHPQAHCQMPPATQVRKLKECTLIYRASPLSLHPTSHPPHHHVGSLLRNPSTVAASHLHPLFSPCLSYSLLPPTMPTPVAQKALKNFTYRHILHPEKYISQEPVCWKPCPCPNFRTTLHKSQGSRTCS